MEVYYRTILYGDKADGYIGQFPFTPSDVYGYKLVEVKKISCEFMKKGIDGWEFGFGEKVGDYKKTNKFHRYNYINKPLYSEDPRRYQIDKVIYKCPYCSVQIKVIEGQRYMFVRAININPKGKKQLNYKEVAI